MPTRAPLPLAPPPPPPSPGLVVEGRAPHVLACVLTLAALALRAIDLAPTLARVAWRYLPLYACLTVGCVLGVLIVERHRLAGLYVSRHCWRESLLWGLVAGWPLGVGAGVWLAWTRFGLHWMPPDQIVPTLGPALAAAFTEELMFRSYLLSWLETRARLGSRWGNVAQAVLFVAIHPRYLVSRDWTMIVVVAAFALVAGAVTLRSRSVLGAVVAHIGLDFMGFVPIGAAVGHI